ncbi:hypothetical protein [Novipirellula sp.]|uniref:hypothetical protein n=1 Tax=Novipirellula sp. TaxID=2795430 RepID=UPI003565365C
MKIADFTATDVATACSLGREAQGDLPFFQFTIVNLTFSISSAGFTRPGEAGRVGKRAYSEFSGEGYFRDAKTQRFAALRFGLPHGSLG